jgi:extracellular elastinolytic metalloproteinase
MPTTPLANFPGEWVDASQTGGNTVRATLNFGTGTLSGVLQNGRVVFDPAQEAGDDQKLLNIFYFCNYMHDFLFILGFDEAAGNFQLVNFTHTGAGGDPVRARAHSGAVNGTANMSTGIDGQPPVMNMGLVVSTNRHTAFDADVVFHEYTHGLTNRLVGGRLNPAALDEPQSSGMGEGWSDYYALTIQNFFRAQEKTVTGDWVVNDPAGIRSAPYDDSFPMTYGQLANLVDEHDVGELWCAALMMMTRRIRSALASDQDGYRMAWQMVTDGLKLTQPNPTFLDARDGILRALDDMRTQSRISPTTHATVRRAAWEAFAHFGMGANAFSADAGLEGITEDRSLPPDLQT